MRITNLLLIRCISGIREGLKRTNNCKRAYNLELCNKEIHDVITRRSFILLGGLL